MSYKLNPYSNMIRNKRLPGGKKATCMTCKTEPVQFTILSVMKDWKTKQEYQKLHQFCGGCWEEMSQVGTFYNDLKKMR